MSATRFPTLVQLDDLEKALAVEFPDSFRRLVAEPQNAARVVVLQSFPDFICVPTLADVQSLQELTGNDMLPFLVTGSLQDGDIYCFHIQNGVLAPQVSTVSDGAVVATWGSFELFIQWANELLEPLPPEELYFVD
ncbi:MAG: SMI1/KNR4 family protein [Bdellovibrionales bacterium]|nr:SMI1/KNR4 family protein [Bdellovibrionales bacterium]